jgi:hypothetical protein
MWRMTRAVARERLDVFFSASIDSYFPASIDQRGW